MSATATLERPQKLSFEDTWANYYALALLIALPFKDDASLRRAVMNCHRLLHSNLKSMASDPEYHSNFLQNSTYVDGRFPGGA